MKQKQFSPITIGKAVSREFWLDSELICGCCVLFIESVDGSRWQVLYDHEMSKWVIENTNDLPIPDTELGDSEFRYPHVDWTDIYSIRGEGLIEFNSYSTATEHIAELIFQECEALVLVYAFKTEKISVRRESKTTCL